MFCVVRPGSRLARGIPAQLEGKLRPARKFSNRLLGPANFSLLDAVEQELLQRAPTHHRSETRDRYLWILPRLSTLVDGFDPSRSIQGRLYVPCESEGIATLLCRHLEYLLCVGPARFFGRQCMAGPPCKRPSEPTKVIDAR